MTTEPILDDPSDAELGAAIENNLIALFRDMVTSLDGEIVEGVGLSYHHAFPANPMFKGVWRARLGPDDADAAIDEAIAWFKARHAPFAFWWSAPGTAPADWGERLAARGIALWEQDAPGMAADLNRLDETVLARVPPGFAIEEVRDASALAAFHQVLIAGFGMPEWAAQAWIDASERIGIGRTPWRLYVGRLHGEPVATNMLVTGGGVASVLAVGTAPAARRQGIGAAITLAPLLAARQEGYRHAVLFATEEGKPVYARLGFREIGAPISRYLWRSE